MLSDIVRSINNKAYEDNEEAFITINVRPTEKILGMLDVITFLEGKSPTSTISKQFSQKLAEFLCSSKGNAPIIQRIIDEDLPLYTGAVGILYENDVIKCDEEQLKALVYKIEKDGDEKGEV